MTNVLKENNYPKSFLYDCLRRPTLTDCNSPECDSAVKGFATRTFKELRNQSGALLIIVVLKQKTLSDVGAYFCETQESRFDQSKNTCCILLYHAVIARKYIWVKQNVSFEGTSHV